MASSPDPLWPASSAPQASSLAIALRLLFGYGACNSARPWYHGMAGNALEYRQRPAHAWAEPSSQSRRLCLVSGHWRVWCAGGESWAGLSRLSAWLLAAASSGRCGSSAAVTLRKEPWGSAT
jgi:hypothetical protein